MFNKEAIFRIFLGISILSVFAMPQFSYADWSIGVGVGEDHHDHDRWREREHEHEFFYFNDHPDWGYHIHYLPAGVYTIWVGGQRYYYYEGLYYQYVGYGDYILVSPPYGAVVSSIPPDFQPVSINGRIYYTSNGIYYRLTPEGYRCVRPPEVYEQPAPVIVEQPQQVIVSQPAQQVVVNSVPAVNEQDTFTVNVPNNNGNGSYTPVIIRRSGAGYVGPQGEYYPTFPSVSQLKTMYVK